MTDIRDQVEEFFERYAAALLARDAAAAAQLYAVPGLILFPDTSIPVNDPSQTEQFFASAWEQYEGIDAASREIVVMGEAPSSVWADVTWRYGGEAGERFCYQLIATPAGYQIAVLTPMEFIP
jgi:ketosteroid isomerase-like protein